MGQDVTRLVGITRFRDERTARELVNTVRIEFDAERAETVIGAAVGPARERSLTSTHPAVIGYQRGVTDLLRRTAYAGRPVRSLWVPKGKRRRSPAVCPECQGAGEVMLGEHEDARMVPCPVCGEA